MVISGLRAHLSYLVWEGRFVTSYNEGMSGEDALLEEVMDNLRESNKRLRAIQARLHSTGLDENPNYRDLSHHVRSALAMTEAALMEARRRAEQEGQR
jgi:hypothetical protein